MSGHCSSTARSQPVFSEAIGAYSVFHDMLLLINRVRTLFIYSCRLRGSPFAGRDLVFNGKLSCGLVRSDRQGIFPANVYKPSMTGLICDSVPIVLHFLIVMP